MELKRRGAWCVVRGALLLSLIGCGGGGLYTAEIPQETIAAGPVQITRNAFLFGSDYPAEIVIPDVDGMRGTAFVVSTESPAGVIAIDLDSQPFRLSTRFKGLTIPPGNGYPRGPLAILNTGRAFCLTSSHAIDFNPTTGAIHTALPLLTTATMAEPRPLSRPFDLDGNGTLDTTATTWKLRFPGGLAVVGDTLFVSFSNYLQATPPAAAAPGVVKAFRIGPVSALPTLTEMGAPILTTDYNPTALLALPSGELLVVNSGVNDIADGKTIPQTNAGIDIIDATNQTIAAHIDLGPVALSFQPPATTAEGTIAYIPSASYGELYAVDLVDRTALFDHGRPITITSHLVGSDYLSDGACRADGTFLFVGSFTHSAIYAIDLRAILPRVLPPEFPDPIVVGFPAGVTPANPSGVNTGIGALAVRPGVPDQDFTGPDLFVLTGTPGTLVAINTRGSGGNPPEATPAADADEGTSEETPEEIPTQTNEPNVPPPEGGSAPTGSAEVLRHPPLNADAFADRVHGFKPGIGSGWGSNHYPENILGAPHGGSAGIPEMSGEHLLTLGCGGAITLAMDDFRIADGPGPDFIVFENAFYQGGNPHIPYAEPGIVGVSMDGTTFVDFPCAANLPPFYPGCAGVHPSLSNPANGIDPTDPTKAGGDAFDLAAVQFTTARFVRIRAASCGGAPGQVGFDLDAVSVIHGVTPN